MSVIPFADLRDLDSWIRCWSAANTVLAEDCLTLSRLRHLMLKTDHVVHQIVSRYHDQHCLIGRFPFDPHCGG